MRAAAYLTLVLMLSLPGAAARAGQACQPVPSAPEAVRKALRLALDTREHLERSGASLAVIGRVGSDLSKHGLRYSHAGFVWRDHPKGRWLVRHLLNHCGTDTSALYDEGLGNFFSGLPFRYEALLVIPSPEVQQRLARMLRTDLPLRLYEPHYNMIANPWATRSQNSNQWLLEVSAATLAAPGAVDSRATVQAWLKAHAYQPTPLRIGATQRLGATLFRANLSFTDHPLDTRLSGVYPVVTVDSVVRFLERFDPATRQAVVELDPQPARGAPR